MRSAFSRFSAAEGGSIDRQDLPDFLRFVVSSMNSAAVPPEQVIARSTELTQQLMEHLPPLATKAQLSLEDILRATEKTLAHPLPAANDEGGHERGRLGSKQLRMLRKRLENNRLTMPLFDTKGWVRDFEKALKIQCAHICTSAALADHSFAHPQSFRDGRRGPAGAHVLNRAIPESHGPEPVAFVADFTVMCNPLSLTASHSWPPTRLAPLRLLLTQYSRGRGNLRQRHLPHAHYRLALRSHIRHQQCP